MSKITDSIAGGTPTPERGVGVRCGASLDMEQWAVFHARVDRLLAYVPNGMVMAYAVVAKWADREYRRDVAEVARCLEKCPEDQKEYWEEKVERVRCGKDEWSRGNDCCDLPWPPEDELDKAARALALRDSFPGPPQEQVYPLRNHHYAGLTQLLIWPASRWPSYLDSLHAALSRRLRAMADACGGSGVSEPHANAEPVLRGCARDTLAVLLKREAFDSDSLMQRKEILADLADHYERYASDTLKDAIKKLKKFGYVFTERGSEGGCWLTLEGRTRAEHKASQ